MDEGRAPRHSSGRRPQSGWAGVLGAIAIEYVEKPSPTITLDEHVAAVLDSPAACRNVLRQHRARHENGELRDAKWSSVSDELERLRTPSGRRPGGWFRGSR